MALFDKSEEVEIRVEKPKRSIFDKLEDELFTPPEVIPDSAPICALFLGRDGTGKSGSALSILTDEDVKEGKRIVVLDLDNGNMDTILQYHREKYENGNIILLNPIVWKENEDFSDIVIDYKETMKQIKAVGIIVQKQWEERKIKAIILDGLSKLLKFSEYQMRVEKSLDVSGGVSLKYWVNRNKSFLEMLELYKSLPIHKIYVGHENFDIKVDAVDVSAILRDTNALMAQKVSFTVDEGIDDVTKFYAKIDKSKQDLRNKNAEICFAEVNTSDRTSKFTWEPEKVLKLLESPEKDSVEK